MTLFEQARLCSISYRLEKETEYQFCRRLSGHELVKNHKVACFAEDDLEGFVMVHNETKHATVVFRGTDEVEDVWWDILALPTKSVCGGGYVRRGVQSLLSRGWPSISDMLTDMGAASVSFIGHSLGAMLAELCALWVICHRKELPVQAITTFAGCPVGSRSVSKTLRAACSSIHHIANCGDPLPFSVTARLLLYRDSGDFIALDSEGRRVSYSWLWVWFAGFFEGFLPLSWNRGKPHRISEYVRRLENEEVLFGKQEN